MGERFFNGGIEHEKQRGLEEDGTGCRNKVEGKMADSFEGLEDSAPGRRARWRDLCFEGCVS